MTPKSAALGNLPALLLLLTVVTGIVDAVSFLRLDSVFVANMTGNVIFIGFAAAGVKSLSAATSSVAIGAFFIGSLYGGRISTRYPERAERLFLEGVSIELALVGLAMLLEVSFRAAPPRPLGLYALVTSLGIAMGIQNAVARRLAVPDLTTTVLTLTLTGIAADSHFAGGSNPRVGRRFGALVAMLAGAAAGAALVLHFDARAALAAAFIALAIVTLGAQRRLREATATPT